MTNREKTQEIKEASKNAFKIQDREQEIERTYSITLNNTAQNENYIEKLKSLQEQLKIEIQKNPEIQLTDEYKKIQEKYDQMIKSTENKKDEIEYKDLNENINEQETVAKQENITEINCEETKEEELPPKKDMEENQNIETENNENAEIENNENIENVETENNQNQEIENNVNTENENTKVEDTENIETAKNENTENNNNIETENNYTPVKEENNNVQENEEKENILSFEEMYKQLFGKEPYGGRKQQEEENKKNYYTIDTEMEESNLSMFEDDKEYNKIQYKFIGIAFNTYIILEIENELYIMDQHAAHERIMYEKVKKNFYELGEKSSQLLLLPDIIELTNKEMDIAKDNFDLFKQAGFTLEEFGENTIKLSGVPEVCIDLNTRDLFKETLDEINTVARTAKQEKEEKFIATIACKAAVKANMKLEKEEVDKLMEELLKLPNPFTCPHGRPTVIKMSKYEIERKFARK